MRRLITIALTAAALAAPAAHADHYTRECGGVLDYDCSGRVCPTDCWTRDCAVWIDPLHDDVLAQCVPLDRH